MKKIFYLVILVFCTGSFYGQCGLVGKAKNKKTGIETSTGIVNSRDYYSLGIQKEKNFLNPEEKSKYYLLLNAASRVKLSDSILKSKGKMELYLNDGIKYTVENVKCLNDPLGLGNSIGFRVEITEEQLKEISNKSFSKLKVIGILETEFSKRTQKQQIKIMNCLLK